MEYILEQSKDIFVFWKIPLHNFSKLMGLRRYINKKNLGEIDFILQRGKDIIPVEIKSGNDYMNHPALNNILRISDWGIGKAYVFCKGNISTCDKITYLPWYMVMFFKQVRLPDNLIVDVNLEGL